MSCCCPHCDLNEDKTIIGIFIPVRNSIKMYHWAHLNYALMHLSYHFWDSKVFWRIGKVEIQKQKARGSRGD